MPGALAYVGYVGYTVGMGTHENIFAPLTSSERHVLTAKMAHAAGEFAEEANLLYRAPQCVREAYYEPAPSTGSLAWNQAATECIALVRELSLWVKDLTS